MQLYHFPSPNPQKVTFALKELGLDCELVPVDLVKGEHRQAAFLAHNPFGRVPVLVDGGLTLPESHAILAYLGEKTGRLWPSSVAGRADALRWLFFLSQHIMQPAGDVALRLRAQLFGRPVDEATVERGEQALPAPLTVVKDHLAHNKWMMGAEFSLVPVHKLEVIGITETFAI
jgi:glutathione S-transferase